MKNDDGWMIDPCAFSEIERADMLVAHDVASADDDAILDRITGFAGALCDAPIALVSLVEEHRQWFPARHGLDARETPRRTSFCAHAMVGRGLMVIPDATADPRFADNPLVTGAPFIRFYAGAPLVSGEGVPLGALCVIDRQPRAGLSPLQRQGLALLAESAMMRLESLRSRKSSQAADDSARRSLHEQEQRFQVLADTMPQMVWSALPDGFHDYYNARWYAFTGVAEGSTDGAAWNEMFHPDDRDRAWVAWRRSLATGEPYDIEYRLRHVGGDYRWVLGRALPIRGPDGAISRWFGTCTDIHDQKAAQEQRELIAHELSHRIKNIFSVIGGLIGFSTRAQPEFRQVADTLRERVMALGRAHDFVRPHSNYSRPEKEQTSLHGMLEELLSPYRTSNADRVAMIGEDARIDDRSATPLALLFHELATNAAKYGALSAEHGQVLIETACDDRTIRLTWTERGGPLVSAPSADGFGTRLIELSAVRQLAGTVERDWRPEGLIVTVTIPQRSMRRPDPVG